MIEYRNFFKDKKITIMGLGVLGRALGYTKFLAECGADLIVTDLKTKEELATSIKALENFPNIKFVLGEHRLEDFRGRDMVIRMTNVSPDSIHLAEARKNNIPIELDVSLFLKCAPEVKVVGVTGTRGKSMTTMLVYHILKSNEKFLKRKIYLGGNIRGIATLPLLKKVKKGDILVCELDSWQLQGFGDAEISPNISVFTSFMPDHMNYYKGSMEDYFNDKAKIFKHQKKDDVLIICPLMKKLIKKEHTKGRLIGIDKNEVKDWKFIVPGEHQRENLACAVKVAEQFDIPISKIKKAVALFKGLEGRLEFLRNYQGVKIYNDNNSTTPEATIAGLRAIGDKNKRKVVLIVGGDDKKLDTINLVKEIPKWCSKVIMFKERGTDTIRDAVFKFTKKGIEVYEEEGLENTVIRAIKVAKKGEIILYSPGFSSFGKYFKNEYERNDQFVKLIKSLK